MGLADQARDFGGGQGDGGQEPGAEPAEFVVGPDPVTLPVGVYSGSFTVTNAGEEAMQWTAASKPSVTLSDSGGELAGGGENVVSFTVDEDTVEAGASSLKVKVMGAGETVSVDVKGARPIDVLKS